MLTEHCSAGYDSVSAAVCAGFGRQASGTGCGEEPGARGERAAGSSGRASGGGGRGGAEEEEAEAGAVRGDEGESPELRQRWVADFVWTCDDASVTHTVSVSVRVVLVRALARVWPTLWEGGEGREGKGREGER